MNERGMKTPISPKSKIHLPSNSTHPSQALVFGHSDADGHLAAEQTRTNLQTEGINVNEVIVSNSTRNYRFWETSFTQSDFKNHQLVVIVDIAFNFRDPLRSLTAVLETIDNYPNTQFLIIDHHPLPQPERQRSNLSLVEVDSAYKCCFGPPSDELMVVAAICDRDEKTVRPRITPAFKKRAVGVRRAAADIFGLAGSQLLNLIRKRRWEFFEELAAEPPKFHLSVRGRRRTTSPVSPLIEAAKAETLALAK